MLFNSLEFVFLFLPLTVSLYYIIKRRFGLHQAMQWLLIASLFFYGYWAPPYLILIIGSLIGNFFLSDLIAKTGEAGRHRTSKSLLVAAVAANLLLLGVFKYTGFVTENLSLILDRDIFTTFILPIGISFFTFQQIAFLVDVYRGDHADRDFQSYALFITFFPQLIAGPIVHHREMMPQFTDNDRKRDVSADLSVGLAIFSMGLFKKVVLADTFSVPASSAFDQVAAGATLGTEAAWMTVGFYMLQIYFDFSGYSDMAIGLARLFGIRLPMNFASPYKATSIIDFWRRWHITLSRFLRDYLYVPLGGGRKGRPGQFANIFLTMLLGGIWHGAGWTFALWGAMHGAMIVTNHLWRMLPPFATKVPTVVKTWAGRLLTFVLVALAWVPFRAANLDTAASIYGSLFPLQAVVSDHLTNKGIVGWNNAKSIMLVSLLMVWFLPNVAEFMRRYRPVISSPGYPATEIPETEDGEVGIHHRRTKAWAPNWMTGMAAAILIVYAVAHMLQPSEFIYFQF